LSFVADLDKGVPTPGDVKLQDKGICE